MATIGTFHPCAFQFRTTNIRRLGNVTDGGTSLSAISDDVESDGGGYLAADFTNGSTRTAEQGKAWRRLTDIDGGEAVNVLLCAERLMQPVGAILRAEHDHALPFDSQVPNGSPGAAFTAAAAAPLRATTLAIAGISELPLVGGELFSIRHPSWGWRAYRVRTVAGNLITFRTPLREAITAGTPLEFDTPRCQMVRVGSSDNTLDMGRFGSCAISFREDTRKPAA